MVATVRGALVVVALLVAGCAGGATASPDTAPPGSASGEVTVLAAASLIDAFELIAEQVEQDHPGLRVTLAVAGSHQLAAQIIAGAQADVFASADDLQMQAVADAGRLADQPVTVASNRLAVVVEPGNPRGVRELADLSRDDLAVVLPAEAVPAGRAARDALLAAGVRAEPVSLEPDVRATLSRVVLGEADAGIVYASDVVAAGDAVGAVAVPDEVDVEVRYPVAVLADAPNPPGARAFVEHLTTGQAQAVFADLGFSAP